MENSILKIEIKEFEGLGIDYSVKKALEVLLN